MKTIPRVVTALTSLLAFAAQPQIQSPSGLRLLVAERNDPVLAMLLPGYTDLDRSIEVIFPEHVTIRRHGSSEGEHLYLFGARNQAGKPAWRQTSDSVEYQRELGEDVHFLARATLQDDGVLFHYELLNHSSTAYDLIYIPTDPRLTGIFHDVRLERTYVHHKSAFELLASETPSRLTMPLSEWLPSRYLASYTWAVPAQRVERRSDGITYYNKSRAVDEPMIATLSEDRQWVVASFTRTTGNVWSNPELTCQHVDPETNAAPGQRATIEVKILVFKGNLDDALRKVTAQRSMLQ